MHFSDHRPLLKAGHLCEFMRVGRSRIIDLKAMIFAVINGMMFTSLTEGGGRGPQGGADVHALSVRDVDSTRRASIVTKEGWEKSSYWKVPLRRFPKFERSKLAAGQGLTDVTSCPPRLLFTLIHYIDTLQTHL